MRSILAFASFCLFSIPAHAVVVRGRVTTPFGAPIAGAHVQLIALTGGTRNAADTFSVLDGSYEIRSDLGGRFLILTSPSVLATRYAPEIGNAFYAGRTDLVLLDIALTDAITPQLSQQSNLRATPLRQLSTPVFQVSADSLLPHATLLPEVRALPSAFLVQLGETGTPAALYARGAPPAAMEVLVDGVSAQDLATRSPQVRFDLATVSSTGLSAFSSVPAIELTPAPNPLAGHEAEAGVLSLAAAEAMETHPVLTYSGDAGGLDTYRNEAVLSLMHSRADALLSFARFDTANDLPASRYHLTSPAANLGYHISAGTSVRFTLRDDLSAGSLPSPYAFFGVAPSGRLASQNVFSSFAFDTRTSGNWHNVLRYGLARKRSEQLLYTSSVAGLPVTIRGANGFTASGTATFLPVPPREDVVTNRDEYVYATDAPLTHALAGVLELRYEDERGADLTPLSVPIQAERVEREHFGGAAGLQGAMRHRFFYTASGLVDYSKVLGLHGAPRIGLTFVPVQAGMRRFRGTSLRLTAATGFREPTLAEQVANPAHPPTPRSRTVDAGVDQDILRDKLTLRADYFHTQFSHESEVLSLAPVVISNALALRAQGLEIQVRFHPTPRIQAEGGYTYLAALVEQTAATPVANPALPGMPIGATTAVSGARPFHRPPNTGFLVFSYGGTAFTATVKAVLAGRSDDSTNLQLNPVLLLPNRNLSPGFASVDASFSYRLSHRLTVYTQLTNLLDDRHIAPLGYLSTPFLARAGLRIRFGRE